MTHLAAVAALVALTVTAAEVHGEEPPRTENGLRTDMWTAPGAPAAELSAYLAAQAWETTYGGRDPSFTVGLTGGWFLAPLLELQGVADFSVRSESPANLRVTNTATFLGVGPSVGLWLGFVRIHLEATGGGVLRTLRYSDGTVSGTDARLAPALQVGGGVGLGLFGKFGLGIRSHGRFHDDRANVLFVLEASWFPGS